MSYYKGRHPLTYNEQRALTAEHKQLLQEYREKIGTTFDTLETECKTLNAHEVFSVENISKALKFSEHVFEASKGSSEGLLKVSNRIISSSVENLKRVNLVAPCNFAVIALGSIAKAEATPYSDLEYGFIVERESPYFQKLAVDSYFRIGNLGETPLKSFAVEELKYLKVPNADCGYRVGQLQDYRQPIGEDTSVGYRIDGITMWSGNIPTGSGINRKNTLTLTVDGFMKLYKEAAQEQFVELADKSDLLSSTVVIYTNEGESSPLHQSFLKARQIFENGEASDSDAINTKRYDVFVSDMKSYTFLPEFLSFKPPKNLSIEIKTEVFRYPTLLANNVKMCMRLDTRFPWDTYSILHEKGILSTVNYNYLRIVLALSIYMRTSAYLSQSSQTNSVTLAPEFGETSKSQYVIPHNIFIILGCLLTPIKRCTYAFVLDHSKLNRSLKSFVVSMMQCIKLDEEDLLPKVEVQYFCGQYSAALEILGTMFKLSIRNVSFSEFSTTIQSYCGHENSLLPNFRQYLDQFGSFKRSNILELCSYLLYYTGGYETAVHYFNWLVKLERKERVLWTLLAAHCNVEIGNYHAGRQLLNTVCNFSKALKVNQRQTLYQSIRSVSRYPKQSQK